MEYGTEVRWSQRMKALEHYNTGMKFLSYSHSSKTMQALSEKQQKN